MGVDCDFPNTCDCGCCSTDEEGCRSMQEEIEDAWEAARMAAQEPGWLHEVLTQNGVPEQIPPFKTGRAPAKARVLFLACDRDNLKRELDAAVEFHRHALDVTYPCLPSGKPDTEPDRWTAIAHRMAELEADRERLAGALREIDARTTDGFASFLARRALAASEGEVSRG